MEPRDFDLNGRALFPAGMQAPWDPAGYEEAKAGRRALHAARIREQMFQVLSLPVLGPEGAVRAVRQAAYPLADVYRAEAEVDRALLMLIPLALLGAALSGAFLTTGVLRRVRHATEAAARISERDLSARLPVAGKDEFSALAATFNGLLDRLESVFRQQERLLEQQRRFTADASHELNTPLTVIKGTASMALHGNATEPVYRHALASIDQAANTMVHLVRDLLLLARSDAGQLGKNKIELLIQEVVERSMAGARVTHPNLSLHAPDSALCVYGNEQELVRLFSNLLSNASRHTPPEGRIEVRVESADRQVMVSVIDSGVGIAPEHLPYLGERFYRVDSARARPDGGTGLGLSICKGIVEAHGGSMSFQSQVGAGTTVLVRLPQAGSENG